jgi:hypothetical protein
MLYVFLTFCGAKLREFRKAEDEKQNEMKSRFPILKIA